MHVFYIPAKTKQTCMYECIRHKLRPQFKGKYMTCITNGKVIRQNTYIRHPETRTCRLACNKIQLLLKTESRQIQMPFWRVTPPFWYAVSKASVRSTCLKKSCYVVRRHHVLLLKGPLFIKKHNKRQYFSQARAFFGSFQYL